MWLEAEKRRPDVVSRKREPRVWHAPRTAQEMFSGAPSMRGPKHFSAKKNPKYHKGAEVLLEAGVVDVLCEREAQGYLRWKLGDLSDVGTLNPINVRAIVEA